MKIELRDKDAVLYFDPPPGSVDSSTVIKCYYTLLSGSAPPAGAAPPSNSWSAITARVSGLRVSSSGVGFPSAKPDVSSNPHGWFYPPHRVVLSHILNEETTEVIEVRS